MKSTEGRSNWFSKQQVQPAAPSRALQCQVPLMTQREPLVFQQKPAQPPAVPPSMYKMPPLTGVPSLASASLVELFVQ